MELLIETNISLCEKKKKKNKVAPLITQSAILDCLFT